MDYKLTYAAGRPKGKYQITLGTRTYLIRGNLTVDQLKHQYAAFSAKYNNGMPFDRWLVERGKVHTSKES